MESWQVGILGKENLGRIMWLNYFLLSYWDKGLMGFSCQNKLFLREDPVVRTNQFPFIWLDFSPPQKKPSPNQSVLRKGELILSPNICKFYLCQATSDTILCYLPQGNGTSLYASPQPCACCVCVCLYMHASVFNKIWLGDETFLFLPFSSSDQQSKIIHSCNLKWWVAWLRNTVAVHCGFNDKCPA